MSASGPQTGDGGEIRVTDDRSTVIDVQRIERVTIVEVLEQDLANIESLTAEASQAQGFFTFTAGVLATVVVGWWSLGSATFEQKLVFGVSTAVSALASFWFGLTWRRCARRRKTLFTEVRSGLRGRK